MYAAFFGIFVHLVERPYLRMRKCPVLLVLPRYYRMQLINKTMLLRNKDREKLITIFSNTGYDFEVWAYGSHVTGEAHDGSDLDLVIRSRDLQKFPIELYLEFKKNHLLRVPDCFSKVAIPVYLFLFIRSMAVSLRIFFRSSSTSTASRYPKAISAYSLIFARVILGISREL